MLALDSCGLDPRLAGMSWSGGTRDESCCQIQVVANIIFFFQIQMQSRCFTGIGTRVVARISSCQHHVFVQIRCSVMLYWNRDESSCQIQVVANVIVCSDPDAVPMFYVCQKQLYIQVCLACLLSVVCFHRLSCDVSDQ